MKLLRLLLVIVLLPLAAPAWAVEPDEVLSDPALEARARELSLELRCLVCQNQSIDDSSAPLARDLRVLIRDRLTSGDSNTQVIDYVVARYGEFVLLRPRFAPHTWALWLGPPVILLFGAWLIHSSFRRRKRDAVAVDPLSAAEQKKLKKLLDEG